MQAPICVIGAGIAGLFFARKVAREGHKVIVLESGYESFDAAIHGLNEIEDASQRYSRALTGRYRGLGGTSSRWGGRVIPISRHEAAERSYISQTAWPFDLGKLDKYNGEIESLLKLDDSFYDGNVFDDGEAPDRFPSDDPYLKLRWAKCPSFKRCNIATVIRKELKSPNIEIWLGATVCGFGVDREHGRLNSVTARDIDGNTLEVRADEFVVAAGTIETTRLLLLLDAATDNQAFRRCDALGRYFQDHLKSTVATISRRNALLSNSLFAYRFLNSTRRDLHLELSEAAQREDRVSSAFAYVSMDLEGSPLAQLKKVAQSVQRRQFDLDSAWRMSRNMKLLAQAARWRLLRGQLFVPADIDFNLLVCVEQLPNRANRIRLAEARDRFGMPKALFEWSPRQEDERTFRSAISHIGAYWRRAGFEESCPLDWTKAAADPALPIIEGAEACAHPSGSTRMGSDPAHSVVGQDLRCHAVPNVAVASASVFPTAGSANPTFTIMKLALWLADSWLQKARCTAPVYTSASPLELGDELAAMSSAPVGQT